MTVAADEIKLRVAEIDTDVSALWCLPKGAWAAYVFAHGAGAGMTHVFMETLATRLSDRGVATLRYQFPYFEGGRRRPDPPKTLHATVRSAVACVRSLADGLPLFAGGKSMGGRMTSQAAALEPLQDVQGLVFVGFPLHPAGAPGTKRAEHLADVTAPMLFLQGTRDKLATPELIQPVCAELGTLATHHAVDGADHGFHVLKRSGRTDDEVLDEIADTTVTWIRAVRRLSP